MSSGMWRSKIPTDLIYFWSLVLLAVAMPLSPFVVSISQFILLGNWLIEGHFATKWKTIISRKGLLAFLLIFAVHILWLFNTTDFQYALKDIKIKLPLLILPLIIATSKPLLKSQLRLLMNFFILAVFVATLISTAVLFEWLNIHYTDRREISIFISHIRFSLQIVISILCLFYYIFLGQREQPRMYLLYFLGIAWFILFLTWLQSLTGLVVLIISMFVLLVVYLNRIKSPFLKVGLSFFIYALPVFILFYIIGAFNKFYDVKIYEKENIQNVTPGGNNYKHDTADLSTENGHFVWMYVCKTTTNLSYAYSIYNIKRL
jgi:hypothetical protein